MGSCMSKKGSSTPHTCSPAAIVVVAPPPLPDPICEPKPEEEPKKIVHAEESVKKEIFVIKQRKSHERRPEEKATEICSSNSNNGNGGAIIGPIRTSSCTKEEVDAILIQCGRLSRSSSSKAGGGGGSCDPNVSSGSRKHLGRKRSYDLDQEEDEGDGDDDDEEEKQQLHRHQSRPSHRRTPSRERDADYKRSSSRDRASSRGGSGGGRKVSRSPGRRSETPPNANANANAIEKPMPGKMVSVPASVSSRDKKQAESSSSSTGIKRVNVKRSTGASPRSQSPANANARGVSNEPSLSRNSSRKADHSPYRRNPLSEIDHNSLINEHVVPLKTLDQIHGSNRGRRNKESEEEGITEKKPSNLQSQKIEGERNNSVVHGGTNYINNNNTIALRDNNRAKEEEEEEQIVEDPLEAKRGVERTTITRSRSSRRSRDLDLNPSTYASLLLEDIQNFHQQKKKNTAFTLPQCVTKACSILEAVADLNSSTTSNLSPAFSDQDNNNNVYPNAKLGKRRLESFVESEVSTDDLMEPSFHKYVTVRRGDQMEQQESSGSNSFVDQHWASSSSWEPNSADSTECWTSRSNTREEEPFSPLQKHGVAETVILCERKKRDIEQHQVGVVGGCGKAGGARRSHSIPIAAAASM